VNQNSRSNHLPSLAIAAILTAVAVPALAVDIPGTPDGTAKAVAEALADRHPEVLWQALPPTYQKDITELTHAFAGKMDPEVWDAAFGLGRKTANLLRDKKDIILASSMLEAAGEKRAEVEGGWDTMVTLLDSFFTSRVSKVDSLKDIDWEKYLATTGRDLMNLAAEKSKASGDDTFDREFTKKLQQTKVEVIANEGDSATLRMTSPDEEPEETQFTRVEGRWVPSDMAKDWNQNVAEARQKLAAITDEEIQQGSMQAMMMIGMVDGVLTQLESVETAEEFDQAIQGILGPFLGGMMGADDDIGDDIEMMEDVEVLEDTESE
jgi:hypothetical protein